MLEGLEIGNMKAVVLMKTLHQLMEAFQENHEDT